MAASGLGPALRPDGAKLAVDPAQAREVFLADADDHTASAALAGLRPDPLAPLGTPITVTDANWGRISRTYIHTSLDHAVTLAAQQEMVATVGAAAVLSIDTGHFPMLVRPDELTDLLLAAVA
jgi:pimeloyl-ACP methyl ester carboxylesterase